MGGRKRMDAMKDIARASAPASIGNVGPGFDVLGQAFDALQDVVTAYREAEPGVRLARCRGGSRPCLTVPSAIRGSLQQQHCSMPPMPVSAFALISRRACL